MKKSVILVGGFHEIIELCESSGFRIIGIIDGSLKNKYMGYKILGGDKKATSLFKAHKKIPIVICPDQPEKRKKLVEYYTRIGFRVQSVISPGAFISPSAKIGNGVVIQNGVNVSSNVFLGDYVKLNTYSNIMHDSKIGDFTTVAPNAVILGKVMVKENCYIGANVTILPGKRIGKNAVVGAGAVVTKDVKNNIVVIGNPAKEIPIK